MGINGLGIDMTDVTRFRDVLAKSKERFLANTFSTAEREYCFSFRDPAPHFAGTFAAKEAIRKATGRTSLPMSALEIRREESGKPEVWIDGLRSTTVHVSISHEGSIASAVALCQTL